MSLYLDHFGLREAPFRITPATDIFFTGANRGNILAALLYAIEAGEGLIKVTGEVGSGKTMLSRMLIEQLPKTTDTIYIATPSLSRDEVLHTLAEELGISSLANRPSQLLRSLQEALIARYERGNRVVVIVDEAHAMPEESLEQIRLLSNLEAGRDKLLQIVLFGQPELDELISRHALRPLRERITHSFTLLPLDQEAVREYIEFRLRAVDYRGPNPFTSKAVAAIARASVGLTRRINILADKALLSAFAANRHSVEKADAERAIADSSLGIASRRPSRLNPWRPSLLAGALVAAAISGWGMRGLANSPPPPTEQFDASAASKASAPVHATATEPAAPQPAARPTPQAVTAAAFVLQLGYSDNEASPRFSGLREQATNLLGAANVRLIPTRIGNREMIALCVGNYGTREQALAAAKELPDPLLRLQPQVRSLAGLEAARKTPSQ
ncbi:MAG TPA: AAA family ATPase [Rhodocyclaceae bacterium]|nr:AAA family ATPase [Rhodocyclaceae bacterium]